MLNKKLIICFLISLISVNVFSMDFNWDFGTVFLGGYTGFEKDSVESEMELDIEVLDFRFSGAGCF